MSSYPPPFTPAPPQPAAGWAGAPAHLPLPPPGVAAFPPVAPPRASGLAVVAVVLAALALLGVVATAFWSGTFEGGPGSDGGYEPWGPLTGQVGVTGGALEGGDLAAAVRRQIETDGGVVERLTCPDTATVDQNVTTVCHAVVDEYEWAMIVFFEDSHGRYTVLPV